MRTRLSILGASTTLLLALGARAQATDALPVCNHNGPYLQECNGQSTYVPVTSAGSFDPDQTPVTVQWFEECQWGFFDDATAAAPNFVIDMGFLCQRACVFELRVFSNGELKKCQSVATVEDTTPPAIIAPHDVTDIWGVDTSPLAMGSATAVDACDPQPSVAMIDEVMVPSTTIGLEATILRTWEASDYCGHAVQATQTIELLSPLTNSSNLELDLTQCDDLFDRLDPSATVDFTLLGRPGTPVTGIKRGSMRLSLLGDPTHFVLPNNAWQFAPADVGIMAAHQIGECNPAGTDGLADLKVRFNRAEIRSVFALDAMPTRSVVYVALTGLRTNNTAFIAGAKFVVQ